MCGRGELLVAGLAQISFALPFTPVPITGQTLGVLLVGAAYGPGLGAATIAAVPRVGRGRAAGARARDGVHATGLDVLRLTAATGGYLWGFVLAAALTGWLAAPRVGPIVPEFDRRHAARLHRDLRGRRSRGCITCSASSTIEETLQAGLYPFIIGDTLKLLAAAGLLPAAWALMKKLRPRNRISSRRTERWPSPGITSPRPSRSRR